MDCISGRAEATFAPSIAEGPPPRRTWLIAASSALFALTVGVAAPAAAQAGSAATTVEQQKVVPGEFNGDLRLLPKVPIGAVAPKIYRPLDEGTVRHEIRRRRVNQCARIPTRPASADARRRRRILRG